MASVSARAHPAKTARCCLWTLPKTPTLTPVWLQSWQADSFQATEHNSCQLQRCPALLVPLPAFLLVILLLSLALCHPESHSEQPVAIQVPSKTMMVHRRPCSQVGILLRGEVLISPSIYMCHVQSSFFLLLHDGCSARHPMETDFR